MTNRPGILVLGLSLLLAAPAVAQQDAIIAGSVDGSVTAESRIELQASCRVQGDIRSRRVKLDEGGQVDGQLHMGAAAVKSAAAAASGAGSSPEEKQEASADQKSKDGGSGTAKSGS